MTATRLPKMRSHYAFLNDMKTICATSPQAPALLHFLMGAIEMTCAETPSGSARAEGKSKPDLRVVPFKKAQPAITEFA